MTERLDITKIILVTIALAGLISLAVLAPNALQALPKLGITKRRHYKYYLPKAIERLKEKGLIEIITFDNKKYFRLTKKGEGLLKKYEQKDLIIKKPKRWDGK